LPHCQIYIFGSILKNTRGGDIDIFIVPKEKLNIKKRLFMQAKIEEILEEEEVEEELEDEFEVIDDE